MQKLNTIQTRENLNEVYRLGNPGPGGAYHNYIVYKGTPGTTEPALPLLTVQFQKGPRKTPNSVTGVLDCDLLEIVRDRLKAFQSGPMASLYNEKALQHVELALWMMNKRVEDRIERNVLGTMEK